VIHLAAQPRAPFDRSSACYADANLEALSCSGRIRRNECRHLVYASSSSSTAPMQLRFQSTRRLSHQPLRRDEKGQRIDGHAYSHLYRLRSPDCDFLPLRPWEARYGIFLFAKRLWKASRSSSLTWQHAPRLHPYRRRHRVVFDNRAHSADDGPKAARRREFIMSAITTGRAHACGGLLEKELGRAQ